MGDHRPSSTTADRNGAPGPPPAVPGGAGALVEALDPMGFGAALGQVGLASLAHPWPVWQATARLTADLARAGMATAARAMGLAADGPARPAPKDRRFSDPAWSTNPWFYGLEQAYLVGSQFLSEVVDRAEVGQTTRRKAAFAMTGVADALAPTNSLLSNPAALRKAFDTGGLSLVAGLRNLVEDVATNQGRPRQVDTSGFRVGESLAATPGVVVYRNHLMELLQFEPTTDTVHQIPLLCTPPWINKYYLMDLAPGRSFVEWAVAHGHTTFVISYRNPDDSMAGVTLDDYLVHGPRTALDVVAEITGSERANVAALCLGGTLTAALLAYLHATGEGDRVASATFLNTLVDFTEPGVLGCFTDEASIARLESRMARRGYLDAGEMAATFDVLRANDLIWGAAVNRWLMGEAPPAFDILAWNGDGTRMPAAMHSFYLRSCYLENRLATKEMELAGVALDLGKVTQDVYLLGAQEDHIAPWTSAYRATQLYSGATRFVLTSSGHVAGVVNPPNPKSRHWVNDELPPDPQTWLARATERPGSWWEDWAGWAEPRGGGRRPPPHLGSDTHPVLGRAPGTYVHGRSGPGGP